MTQQEFNNYTVTYGTVKKYLKDGISFEEFYKLSGLEQRDFLKYLRKDCLLDAWNQGIFEESIKDGIESILKTSTFK